MDTNAAQAGTETPNLHNTPAPESHHSGPAQHSTAVTSSKGSTNSMHGGIGLTIARTEGGLYYCVTNVEPTGPCVHDLRKGDELISVDSVPVVGVEAKFLLDMLAGPVGRLITLEVRRGQSAQTSRVCVRRMAGDNKVCRVAGSLQPEKDTHDHARAGSSHAEALSQSRPFHFHKSESESSPSALQQQRPRGEPTCSRTCAPCVQGLVPSMKSAFAANSRVVENGANTELGGKMESVAQKAFDGLRYGERVMVDECMYVVGAFYY
jgi:hypothetical protein